jgi:hypothetical protein
MNGKNNLEEYALADFMEMARVDVGPEVNFIVELGRPYRRIGPQLKLEQEYGGWSGVRRFQVVRGTTPEPGQELEVVLGDEEVDMGSERALVDFLRWGKERFPARRYAVILWNHGQGYRLVMDDAPQDARIVRAPLATTRPSTGPAADIAVAPTHRAVSLDGDTGSIIFNSDLRAALKTAAFGDSLRLIGFDACLMAMVETAYELRDTARIIVASEELEPGDGWNYSKFAQLLAAHPNADEIELAKGLVDNYRTDYGNRDSTTLSAVETAAIKPLAAELSALSDALVAARQTLFPLVRAARHSRSAYNGSQNPVTIDLIGFLEDLEGQLLKGAPLSDALVHARKAKTLAEAAVLASYASNLRSGPYGSHGIAIYFPETKGAFNRDAWHTGYLRSNKVKVIDFVANEHWSAFLQAYLGLPQ